MPMWFLRPCSDTGALIQKAAEGVLSQPERDRLMAHLVACGRCRRQVLDEAAMDAALTRVGDRASVERSESCPPDEVLEAFATTTFTSDERRQWAAHVASCGHCQAEIAQMRAFLADSAEGLPELGLDVSRRAPSQLPSLAAQVRSLSPAVTRRSSLTWVSAVGLALILALAVPAFFSLQHGRGGGPTLGTPGTQVASRPARPTVPPELQPTEPAARQETPVPIRVAPPTEGASAANPAPVADQPRHAVSPRPRHPKRPRPVNPVPPQADEEAPVPGSTAEPPMIARALPPSNGPIGVPELAWRLEPGAPSVARSGNALQRVEGAMALTAGTAELQHSALQEATPAGIPSNPLPAGQGWRLQDDRSAAALDSANPLTIETGVSDVAVPDIGAATRGGAANTNDP